MKSIITIYPLPVPMANILHMATTVIIMDTFNQYVSACLSEISASDEKHVDFRTYSYLEVNSSTVQHTKYC